MLRREGREIGLHVSLFRSHKRSRSLQFKKRENFSVCIEKNTPNMLRKHKRSPVSFYMNSNYFLVYVFILHTLQIF